MLDKQTELAEKIYDELLTVRRLLEMLIRNELIKNIESIATTDERRKIYTLMDGFSSTEEIAQKIGVSQRTVQMMVKELAGADLVILEKRGYPRRTFDYIPSGWNVSDVPRKD
jgi:predicted transcriptional regulator